MCSDRSAPHGAPDLPDGGVDVEALLPRLLEDSPVLTSLRAASRVAAAYALGDYRSEFPVPGRGEDAFHVVSLWQVDEALEVLDALRVLAHDSVARKAAAERAVAVATRALEEERAFKHHLVTTQQQLIDTAQAATQRAEAAEALLAFQAQQNTELTQQAAISAGEREDAARWRFAKAEMAANVIRHRTNAGDSVRVYALAFQTPEVEDVASLDAIVDAERAAPGLVGVDLANSPDASAVTVVTNAGEVLGTLRVAAPGSGA